ncbi:hypothetical protein HK098_007529 [Nowakowskiella sp. JEL0407]|nr:hypothetical protein HK098_007529 [Nowakowskiella sp. JEL0407]
MQTNISQSINEIAIQSKEAAYSTNNKTQCTDEYYDEDEYSESDDPMSHYNFEKYLHYGDFSATSHPKSKNHISRTQKTHNPDWKFKVTKLSPNAKLFEGSSSNRKNVNATNSLHNTSSSSSSQRFEAPWNKVYWYTPPTSIEKTFKTCIHSPITPTDCRLCGNYYGSTKKLEKLNGKKLDKTAKNTPAKKAVVPSRVASKPTTRKRLQECDCDTKCQLDTPKCCACMDQRPTRDSYWAYFDGYGYRQTVNRSVFYCPGCNSLNQESSASTTASSENAVSTNVGNDEVAENEDAKVSSNVKSKPNASHAEPEQTFEADSEISFDVISLKSPHSMSSWSSISDINNPKASTKSCGHECCLKIPAKCCGCSDERPVEETYWVYLVRNSSDLSHFNLEQLGYDSIEDGVLVETSRRDQLYCEYCKNDED